MVTARITHVLYQATSKKARAEREQRAKKKRQQRSLNRSRKKSKEEKTATLAKIAAKKKSKRVVELEATIRTSRIGIVVEFGTARLLQPQSHTYSSHLLVGCWILVVEAR
jgi:hypothetical protein